MNIDPMNFSVIKVECFNDEKPLLNATAFFFKAFLNGEKTTYLVTNWHVLSGFKASGPKQTMHPSMLLPNKLKITVPSNKNEKNEIVENAIYDYSFDIYLYDNEGTANWFQHKLKGEVDIAIINLGDQLEGCINTCINDIANTYDMQISVGNDVLILGFPLDFSHFGNTPIWKKGIIASEPHLETPSSRHRIVIDATTRSGMSGSPVIMKCNTHYISNSGKTVAKQNASRFIGVYASRPSPQASNVIKETWDYHELGYVYKSGLIEEIISDGIRGDQWY